ncbi:MAG TPA: RyR domain-containing protein [Chloroflexota bacterium]|nr:RyR domain-containing protein [Chloroflexota bacterium]
MSYTPNPIDTSHVELSEEILELTELLARNTHDVYVQQRLSEGWTYGPRRDDETKRNPTLVPYEDLPEEEKEYDRRTALETLKALLALGYRVARP